MPPASAPLVPAVAPDPVALQGSVRSRRFLVSPVFGGVEWLRAEYVAHRFTPHAQATAVIGVVTRGSAVVRGAGLELHLGTGSVLVIPPGIVHDAHSLGSEPWHYRAFYLTAPQMAAISGPAGVRDGGLGAIPFVIEEGAIAEQVLALHAALASVPVTEAMVRPAAAALLATLGARAADALRPTRRAQLVAAGVARVRRVLDEEPLTHRTLAEMAEMARLGRFTFAHAFSKAYGIAPHAYALQRRVSAVRELLVTGEQVSRAAHHVGFADQSHLTRRFLSVVGVTPGEFRRAWQVRSPST